MKLNGAREESVWDACFGAAWANTEILGVLERQFKGTDGTIDRRRIRCESLANQAVKAFRQSLSKQAEQQQQRSNAEQQSG